jgi:hypothetical protein
VSAMQNYVPERGRNLSASGTLEKGEENRAYFGIGRDSRGETIEISLYGTARYSATTIPSGSEKTTKYSSPANTSPNQTRSSPISSPNKVRRNLHGIWKGISENITGSFTTDNSRRTGKIDLSVEQPRTRCIGEWSLAKGAYDKQTKTQGVWSLTCNDSISVSGTFLLEKRGQGAIIDEDNKK